MGWIKNATRGKKISAKVEKAGTPLLRMRGLMFAPAPKCILFEFGAMGIYPIHSFFVKFPFDAVYIDGKGKATEIFCAIQPNTPLLVPKKKAAHLLEMPCGHAKKLGIRAGDKIETG